MKPSSIPRVQEGVHAWNLPTGLPRTLSGRPGLASPTEATIERLTEDWDVEDLGGRARRLRSPIGALLGDVGLGILRRLGVLLSDFDGMLAGHTGAGVTRPYKVRVFSDRNAFCTYAACLGAANAESLYDPGSQEIGLWYDWKDANFAGLERIFAHEVTHAYMDLAWDVTSPLWFAEGMAEYFGNYRWQGRLAIPGQVDPELVRWARSEDLLTLTALVGMPRQGMYGHDWQRLYALSWSVVHWLYAERPVLVDALLRRGPLPDPAELDSEWRTYVGRL